MIDDLRSGLSLMLLNWAVALAPNRDREKTSLVMAVGDHCERIVDDEWFNREVAKYANDISIRGAAPLWPPYA